MKITTARRLAQIFFFALFVWLTLVATVGTSWTQWRGWPVAWFLQLDPLVALGTVLSTRSFHPLLAWSLVTLALTVLFGRVFCGFVCPFGALHQFVGWLGRFWQRAKDKISVNAYRPSHAIKYYLLTLLLSAAAGNLVLSALRAARASLATGLLALALVVAGVAWLSWRQTLRRTATPTAPSTALRRGLLLGLGVGIGCAVLAAFVSPRDHVATLLLTGWLDPIPLLYRSFNVAVLPAGDLAVERWFPSGRFYAGAGLIGGLFLVLLLLNLVVPRFFCRVLCPLGALLGVLGRGTLWSIGRTGAKCNDCNLCDVDCEGACNPNGPLHVSECLMCMNCLDTCPTAAPLGYQPRPSPGGEVTTLGVSRRGFLASAAAGLLAAPLSRLEGTHGSNWSPSLVRPPGSVAEEEFLARCLKCTACLRVCPTNTLQPAGFEAGWSTVWTPVVNNRIGTSGCQLNCIACGHACPTGAIRPLTLAEKHGTGDFERRGPIRIGLAYVDRGRCLPWAMERPCIVCEENCPVTPKAIGVSIVEATVGGGQFGIAAVEGSTLRLNQAKLEPGRYATGDYFCRIAGDSASHRITANTADTVTLESAPGEEASAASVEIQVRLQRPVVDPSRCIGCGVCEHECPLSGLRGIRVTADNETREPGHAVLLHRST